MIEMNRNINSLNVFKNGFYDVVFLNIGQRINRIDALNIIVISKYEGCPPSEERSINGNQQKKMLTFLCS
jgi:hypothetical protein